MTIYCLYLKVWPHVTKNYLCRIVGNLVVFELFSENAQSSVL